MTRSREWLLLNAVESWLHHYEDVGNADTIQLYKQLRDELHDAYMQTLNKDAEPTEPEPKPTPQRRTTRAKAKDAK